MRKPNGCTHPDCFSCPFNDCRYDVLTTKDFAESNELDRQNTEWSPTPYKQREQKISEYQKEYYLKNRERIIRRVKEYQHRKGYTRPDRTEYYRRYYEENREWISEKNRIRREKRKAAKLKAENMQDAG